MTTQAEQVAGSDITHTMADGSVVVFRRIRIGGWAQIQKVLEQKHKESLRGKIMILKDAGMNIEVMPAAIRQMSMEATTREVVNYMHTPKGAMEVLKIGAVGAGSELPQSFFDSFDDPFDLIDLAADVANLLPPQRPDAPESVVDDRPLVDGLSNPT